MATKPNNRGNQSKNGMDWGAAVRPDVVHRPNDRAASDANLQKFISAILVVLFIVLMILIPALALMWGDLNVALNRANAATEYAISEARKMRELRAKILSGE